MSSSINKLSNYFLASIAVLFLLFYLILSFNNRLASDDIYFAALIKNKNIWDGVNIIYHTWSGRWTDVVFFFSVLTISNSFQNIHYWIFLYHCITLVILIYSINKIIRVVTSKIFDVNLSFKNSLVYSILFIAGFYFSTFQHIEVWWWFSASFCYLQGIVFLLFGIALLLVEKKNKLQYVLISLSFIYVGACFEIYIAIIFCLFLAIFIYFYLKKKEGALSFKVNYFLKGFVIAFLSFCFSTAIFFSAPGNIERMKIYKTYNSSSVTTRMLNTLDFSNVDLFQKKYLLAFGLASLWFLIGMKIKKGSVNVLSQLKKSLFIALILLLISIVITLIFQFFILYGKPLPLRAWTFTSFSLFVFCSILFLFLGYFMQNKFISILFLKVVVPLSILVALTYSTYKQYTVTSVYSEKYDQLISVLINEKENKATKTFYVDPLPNSGMLVYLYLDGYTAVPLQEILDLDFEIKLREK